MIRRLTLRSVVVTALAAASVVPMVSGGAAATPTSFGPPDSTPAAASDDGTVDVIITYDDVGAASTRSAVAGRDDVVEKRPMQFRNAIVAAVPADKIDEIAAQPGVARVDLDLPVHAANQSAADGARVPLAMNTFGVNGDGDGNTNVYTNADAVAAVLDTGIDATHPGLDGGKVIGWHNAIGTVAGCPAPLAGPFDDDATGHGTHVAGTVAGTGEGNIAGRGMAPAAALVAVKVLDCFGDGSTSTVLDGIDWVIANRAQFGIAAINLSIEGTACTNGTDLASQGINEAFAKGILVTVAAGNLGPGQCTVTFPGTARDGLTVGAAEDPSLGGWNVASFSGRGPTLDSRIKPDIVASGVSVLSARNGGGYQTISGTSMSTPVVTGIALLMHDLNPAYTAAQLKNALTSTANNFGALAVPNNTYGYGAVDAFAALGQVNNNPPPAVIVATFAYGKETDIVIIGDWDGNGTDTPGVRRGKIYYLNNSNAGGGADIVLGYGKPDDDIFVGDWDGNGTDTLAVRRGNVFFVRNSITSGPADIVFGYGRAGDEVLVGDWNGDGIDTFAVRRGNIIYTRDDFISGPATNVFGYGKASDELIVGDWNGDSFDTFGVHRENVFFLKNSNTSGPADSSSTLGQPDDLPLAGDWNGDGTDQIGVRDGRIHRLAR